MGSGLRQPFPWEHDGPRRVEHELEAREVVSSHELDSAVRQVEGLVPTHDGRSRRGAEGAADWTYREMRRLGIETTRQEVRDRVNRARAVSAAKRHR